MEERLSASTIFANNTARRTLSRSVLVAVLSVLILLAGCGVKEVNVQGEFPEPLMTKLPLTLGIWYGEDFRNHEFFEEAKSKRDSEWLVKTGDAQVQMWNTLLNGMFVKIVPMRAEPGPDVLNQIVDAVLIPTVDELQYAIPAHTNVKVYEIWMRYRYELVTNTGEPIADWTMTSYGKTPTAFLQSDEAAVNLAAVIALRDAGANFATNFTQVPAVREWLEQQWRRPVEQAP
jgi:hypothetical protein